MGQSEALLTVRRFDALVTYHPYDGLTPVEQHLLLAVVAGIATVEAVAEHLGLPRRMLLDAVIDLLSIGALEIGPSGQLVASERLAEAIGDWKGPRAGWQNTFATSAAPPAEAVALMQETVSGCVFRALPRQPTYRPGLHRLPQDPDLPPIDEIPRPELLAAVLARSQLLKTNDLTLSRPRRARIGEVRLRRADVLTRGLRPAAELSIQHVMVDIRAAKRDDEPPRFAVLGPDNLPAHVRGRVGSALGRLWEKGVGRGAGQVFSHLPYEEDIDTVANTARLELAAAPLERLERRLAAVGPRPTPNDHNEMLALERDASDAVTRAVNAGARVALVEGSQAHHDAMLEALEDAEQQVVLVSPWVGQLKELAVRTAIGRAVERGVNVFLLWGIGREDAVPPHVASLRDEIETRGRPGGFRVAERSASCHAKVIVCDHDWAIVTSCNFLNSAPTRTTSEVGVRLTSPPPFVDVDPSDSRTAPSHPISELLRWTRTATPDYRVGRMVGDSPTLFGLSSVARRVREPPQILPPQHGSLLDLWTPAWSSRVRELREDLGRTETYAVLVDGAEHRDVLFDGIATAQRRIFIESPKVTPVTTAEPFARALEAARGRNVDVALRYSERDPAGPDGDRRWQVLASAGVRRIEADTHAKLLVVDDWALVSSFNFLSFEGRRRRELGVQVVDIDLANLLASRFVP